MNKPQSLRDFITPAIPWIRQDPDRLVVHVEEGGEIVATGAGSDNLPFFEMRYKLRLILLDFVGSTAALHVALLVWISRNQVELLQAGHSRPAYTFEAEILDADKTDVTVVISLSERVGCVPTEGGGYQVLYFDEPAVAGAETWAALGIPGVTGAPILRELYLGGDLVASFEA